MLSSATLGTLQIHSNTGAVDFWLQDPVEGLESPEYRTTDYDRAGEDGATISSQLYGGRSIMLRGVIKGASPSIYETNRRLFGQACAITRDSEGLPAPIRLTFTTLAGSTYYVDAYLKDRPVFASENIKSCHYLLKLVTADSFVRSNTATVSSTIVRPSGGGFILPVILPITSSAQTGGSGIVNNGGTVDVYPTLTLVGPLTNPYISNSTTGGPVMQLNYTIASGSSVVIDMKEKTIVLNGSSSLLSTRTDGSTWWALQPGNNTIAFSTGSTSDTGTLQLSFNAGFIGI